MTVGGRGLNQVGKVCEIILVSWPKVTLGSSSSLKLYFKNHCYISLTCNGENGTYTLECGSGSIFLSKSGWIHKRGNRACSLSDSYSVFCVKPLLSLWLQYIYHSRMCGVQALSSKLQTSIMKSIYNDYIRICQVRLRAEVSHSVNSGYEAWAWGPP